MTAADCGAVGFVGLGNIGKAMARRLVEWPGGLWVHDVLAEPCAELEKAGAHRAGELAELARQVDLVCVMVRDDEQVREVLGQVLGAGRDGAVVAVHSTVAPATPAQLADVSSRHGVRVVDAPVSGGPMGAADGTLAVMAGGTEEAFRVCAGPFDHLATQVVHAGPIGAGTRMKLARNLLHFASFTAATEAQRLAEASGLDLLELGKVVRHTDSITGGPGSIMHRDSTAPLDSEDFWFGVFEHVRALGEKDLRFAIELADELEVELPMAEHALRDLGRGLGLPAEDGKAEES